MLFLLSLSLSLSHSLSLSSVAKSKHSDSIYYLYDFLLALFSNRSSVHLMVSLYDAVIPAYYNGLTTWFCWLFFCIRLCVCMCVCVFTPEAQIITLDYEKKNRVICRQLPFLLATPPTPNALKIDLKCTRNGTMFDAVQFAFPFWPLFFFVVLLFKVSLWPLVVASFKMLNNKRNQQ